MKKQKPPVVQDERFAQFIEQIKKLDVAVLTWLPHTRTWRKPETEFTGHFIFEEWTTGGLTGGNCWGGEADEAVSSDPEPEFVDFDRILEAMVPGISFLSYKRLSRELVERADHTNNEYYGNYYTKAVKWIDLKKMYDLLSREGLLRWDS